MVFQVGCVSSGPCDDCDRERVVTAERNAPRSVLVVVLAGCERCEGAKLVVVS